MSREYPCVYFDNEKCRKFTDDECISWCVMGPCSHETQSNGDRIRAMDDEELGDFLGDWADRHLAWMADSRGEVLAWLKESALKEGVGNG